jgi:dTDP-glucose 4,6-dehydratase/UDP-glucose 4-epimerase
MALDQVFDRAGPLWSELHAQPILLTGGTGFFGRWLLESLVHAQARLGFDLDVVVLTRDIQAFRTKAPHLAASPHIQLHQGDVRDFIAPRDRFAFIIHGAATSAKATFDGEDPLTKFDTAVGGMRRVLDAALAAGKPRMLVLSSGSVYGGATGPLLETYLGAPFTLDTQAGLGHGKRAAESLCACYADRYDLSVTIARCFSFVGAYLPLDIHYAIGNFIRNALHDDAITVTGDGTPVRSYLFAGDLVVWLLTLLLRGQSRRIYNVGSGNAISMADLAVLVRDVVAPDKLVRILGNPGSAPRSYYVPDVSLARRELGLDVWTPLADAIRQTADAARMESWRDG